MAKMVNPHLASYRQQWPCAEWADQVAPAAELGVDVNQLAALVFTNRQQGFRRHLRVDLPGNGVTSLKDYRSVFLDKETQSPD